MPLGGVPISPPTLPDGWSLIERVDGLVQAQALTIRRIGLCAKSGQSQAVGSAADVDEDPTPRATFELLERIALVEAHARGKNFSVRSRSGETLGVVPFEEVFPASDAPQQWVFARSSGVSLHSDWASACDVSAAELVERDRVLRAWMGEAAPAPIPDGIPSWLVSAMPSYDWRSYVFPPGQATVVGAEFEVVGAFGVPKSPAMPLVYGFAARRERREAMRIAQREALQLLAFLWGEPIPERAPDPLPAPMSHLETYQAPDGQATLLRWLDEGHARHFRPGPPLGASSFRFADLTPPWLEGRLSVAKALCPAAIPLTFGQSPLLAHLPSVLRVHPIP